MVLIGERLKERNKTFIYLIEYIDYLFVLKVF